MIDFEHAELPVVKRYRARRAVAVKAGCARNGTLAVAARVGRRRRKPTAQAPSNANQAATGDAAQGPVQQPAVPQVKQEPVDAQVDAVIAAVHNHQQEQRKKRREHRRADEMRLDQLEETQKQLVLQVTDMADKLAALCGQNAAPL
ncbi:hypothetical protein M3Y99_01812400 [Aphelenchoides fujianensis]|nr:hypothetical protein M3Y99_01893500 [Aphelenchoides fujianensis]KAI6216575.1 hypothetical protein M3Y99_01812400 [Aphelenchoides fujianensis]